MSNRKFDPTHNELIVAVAKDFRRGYTGNTTTDARLHRYKPEDIKHNLDYIAQRADQSTLLQRVLDGDSTYTQETHELFPFYVSGNGVMIPADYDSRLHTLIEDLNGFRLGNEEDLRDQFNMWSKYVSNPVPTEKVNRLTRENAQRVASRGTVSKFLREFSPDKFRSAYFHLETRAKKADSFLDNLAQLYGDIDASLRRPAR